MRLVDEQPKSKAEIEQELIEKHEEELKADEPAGGTPPVIEEPIVESNPTLELNDDIVLSFIKEKKNLEIGSLDEFDELMALRNAPKQEIDEVALAYDKYKKETGRSIDDFIKLQKDWSSVDAKETLAEFYRQQDPDITKRELEYKLRQFEYDEDLDEEDEVVEKQFKQKQELKEALKFFESQKEQYKMPVASADTFVPESEKENYNAYKQYEATNAEIQKQNAERYEFFAGKTNELFSDQFEGFKFKVGESELKWKPADASTMKSSQLDTSKFFQSFVDENGYIKDAEGFHKAMAAAMNVDKLVSFAYEQGKADGIVGLEKESKNLDLGIRETPKTAQQGGIKMRVLDDGQPTYKIKK